MNKIVVASMRKGAGKTSLIVGMAEALGKKTGYMKPFGDRVVYKKKRIWDYDTALMTNLYGLEDNPEDMCFGFDHSKLSYTYSGEGTRKKLLESVEVVGKGKDNLFIEGGRDLMYGTYVHLGSLSLAKHTGAKLIVILSGDSDSVIDDAAFLKKYLDLTPLDFGGVVINKVSKVDEFKKDYLPQIEELGIDVLGVVPHEKELTRLSLRHLSDALFAKVVTGEENLNRVIKKILIGAMAIDAPLQKILAENKEKLLITAGDRSDMILAALESDTEAILLTNGILPPANIISKAEEKGIPLLLVPFDTYTTAKKVDELEPLMTKDEKSRVKLLGKLAKEHLDLKKIAK
jgi:hypothetical protein